MEKFECPKCNGKGEISIYKNVAGGVCFMCGGHGFLTKRPAKASVKFAIAGETVKGEIVSPVFHISAKTEAEAIKKANMKFANSNGMKAGSAKIAD